MREEMWFSNLFTTTTAFYDPEKAMTLPVGPVQTTWQLCTLGGIYFGSLPSSCLPGGEARLPCGFKLGILPQWMVKSTVCDWLHPYTQFKLPEKRISSSTLTACAYRVSTQAWSRRLGQIIDPGWACPLQSGMMAYKEPWWEMESLGSCARILTGGKAHSTQTPGFFVLGAEWAGGMWATRLTFLCGKESQTQSKVHRTILFESTHMTT